MELEDAFMVEHESHAAAVAQRTAALVEIHADVGHRAVGIVGRSLHEEGDAVRAVAFVDHLLVIGGILLGGTLDGTLDVLLGHVLGLGVLHQDTQAGIARRVGAPGLDGDLDFLTDLGKHAGHVSPALQFTRLAILKCSSHMNFSLLFYSWCKGIKLSIKK